MGSIAVHVFVRLSVAKMHTQNRDFIKKKQFRDDLY